jgi:hypothetical protein
MLFRQGRGGKNGAMMKCPLLTMSSECFDPHFLSNVCYDPTTFCPLYHCDQPRIVPEFIVQPGHGVEPRVDEQFIHLLCDTLTQVIFVHFGSKCHNTQMKKQGRQYITVRYTTVPNTMVHYTTVHFKTVCYRTVPMVPVQNSAHFLYSSWSTLQHGTSPFWMQKVGEG